MMSINGLINKVEKIIGDPKYNKLREFWHNFYELKRMNTVPLKITFTMTFFAKKLDLNLINHYQNPKKYIEDSLKIINFQYTKIHDDRILGGVVINYGEPFESSLFGSKPIFKSDNDPWIGEPIIKTEEDLDDLNFPDFYESGSMPQIIQVYEAAEKKLKGRIPVIFENWDRSPWGTAVHLRGLVELFKDTIHKPDFVHKLLNFITESRIKWEKEKAKYLGVKAKRGSLANDEVDAQLISSEIYQKYAHPYEMKLANFYPEGIFYFHSCGNITPFLDTISYLPGLRRLHISHSTDFKTAVNKFSGKMAFQKRMHPVTDILICDYDNMEIIIKKILDIGKNTNMELDPGPLQEIQLERLQKWITIARKTIKSELSTF